MKRIFPLIVGFLALCLSSSAQQRALLFPDFVDGNVRFIGNTRVEKLKLNFDMIAQKVLYLDGETLMEITNMPMIQTIVTEDRSFIMRQGMLCEIKGNDDFQVLVNWKVKKAWSDHTGESRGAALVRV